MLPRFVDSSNRPSYCSPFHLYLPVSLSTNVHPSRLSVFFSAIGFYDISLFVSSIFIQTYSAKQLLRNLKNSRRIGLRFKCNFFFLEKWDISDDPWNFLASTARPLEDFSPVSKLGIRCHYKLSLPFFWKWERLRYVFNYRRKSYPENISSFANESIRFYSYNLGLTFGF